MKQFLMVGKVLWELSSPLAAGIRLLPSGQIRKQRKENGNLSLLPFRWTLPPSPSSLETILGTHPRLSPGVLH